MKTILIEMQVNDATAELTPEGVSFAIQQAFGPETVGKVTAKWYPFDNSWVRHDYLDAFEETHVMFTEGYMLADSSEVPLSDEQIATIAQKVADARSANDEFSSEYMNAIRDAYFELFGNEEEGQ